MIPQKYKHIVRTSNYDLNNRPPKGVCIYNPKIILKEHLKLYPNSKASMFCLMSRIYKGRSINKAIKTPYLGHGGARNLKSNKKKGK